MTIRILRLTNIDDLFGEVPPEQRSAAVAGRILSEAAGEDVEETTKGIWPDPELPGIIAGWVRRYEPDLVLIRISSYWFTYESVPLRIERALGPWSRRLTKLGNDAAANPRIGHNRAFKLLQKGMLRTIGGATLLTPDQTVDVTEACLRPILAREGVGVVVRGPRTPFGGFRSRAALLKSEEKRQYVNRKLAELCRHSHVTFAPFESMDDVLAPGTRLGDGVHTNVQGQLQTGIMEGEGLVAEWRRVAMKPGS